MPSSIVGTERTESGSPEVEVPLGARIGQYEVIRKLGHGGMGEVHLARDLRLGRLVAIKLWITPRPDLDERILAEARATARCRHENIVVIYEVGTYLGRTYMVLEYIEGQTLRQWMNDRAASAAPLARVPPARAIELMLPVVRALACAHEQGVIHRDLKPENIMLTRAGAVKVLDFGIARWAEPSLSGPELAGDPAAPAAASALAGTRSYMSPEQALGVIDHRSDVWAVGITLYELISGTRPVMGNRAAPEGPPGLADEHAAIPSASERVPELGPLAGVIDRCLIEDAAHRTPSARVLLAELEALASRGLAPASQDDSPFTGLAAFQEVDAGRFFGRDREIDRVLAALRSQPMVALVGRSGVGKSSLVRAGVLPALRRSGEGWDVHVVRPGREPLAALAGLGGTNHLSGDGASSAEPGSTDRAMREQLRAEPGTLGARLRAFAANKRRRILVFVDQLEELYTLGAPQAERAAFLTCLAAIADDATSPLRVLISIRSDFFDRLAADRGLGAELTGGLVVLPPMDRASMREALTRPVEASDHRFEPPALVDRMVEAVAATQGALPLLQFTAAQLWERRDLDRRLLTEASYERLGGVAGALTLHADAVVAGMSAEQQMLARAVLERMVTPERTRALVSMTELHALHRDPVPVDDIVHHLATTRLVVVDRATEGTDPTVELVHESLIDRWPTLVRWLADNQDDAAMLARLRAAARDWERGGRAAGLLWTGEVARDAGAWWQRYRGELSPAEQRYLAAVVAAADRARRRRRRLFGGILTVAVLAAITLGWLAWQQTEARQRVAAEAMRARDATRMAAMRTQSGDPTTQLSLLREIEDVRAPPPEAAQEAKRLLHAGVAALVFTALDQVPFAAFSPDGRRIVSASLDRAVRVWNADGTGEPLILRGHEAEIQSVAFSPDGGRIVSGSNDHTIRVWNVDGTGESLVLRGHNDGVASVAFSPDGRRIVSASFDRTVRVWNADGTGEPLVLRGHGDRVYSAAWSPDGRRVVSGAQDNTVRVWNSDGSGEPLILRGHHDKVYSVAFSADGRHIVSGSADAAIRVWNADGSGEPRILRGHDTAVYSVVFSPDGQRIVSASPDATVRVWNVDDSGEPVILRGHRGPVYSAMISPDGRRIVSASFDKSMRVWNVDGASEPLVLRLRDTEAHAANGVTSVDVSPDGQRIASGWRDGAVRVWSADGRGEPLVLRGHDDWVLSVAFSPDGQRIVSASSDRTVRVWSADGRGEPLVLRGHDNDVESAEFSPDGRRIASASLDRTIRVWSADGRGEPSVLRGHGKAIGGVAFSPDGRRIASASFDRTVRVWNADGSGEPLVLRGHDDGVNKVAFSPDGQRIVSGSIDRTVRVWNADGHGEPLVLRGHDAAVQSARFSSDGAYVVSASDDRAIRVWRADGSGEPVVLTGHDLEVTSAGFSPDGRRIVSASNDGTVRVWHDLAPVTVDDARLWTATSYCLPIERRIKLLGVSEDQARRDLERCRDRVARAPH